MAKLYFKYGAMGSSKTAQALITKFNYEERGMRVWLIKPATDVRDGAETLSSRIGLSASCRAIDKSEVIGEVLDAETEGINVIIADESQFFTEKQIDELRAIVNERDIPVLCFGLRTDFLTRLFPGSKRLLEIADELSEIKTELAEGGYLSDKSIPANKKKKTPAAKPLAFTTTDGLLLRVGRNNRQNDLLTLKTASKNDLWFHTKDIPGSHTVIITEGREVSDEAILEAAQIAAYFSKAKESSQVPVDYTLIKRVNKPQGAKPGKVIYTEQKTVYVTPRIK